MRHEPEPIESIDWCYDIGQARLFGCGEVAGEAAVVVEDVDTNRRGERQPHKWYHDGDNSFDVAQVCKEQEAATSLFLFLRQVN